MHHILSAWKIDRSYKIESLDKYPDRKLIITPKKKFLLKEKRTLPLLIRENNIISYLSNLGFPVNPPLTTTEESPYFLNDNTIYCLYRYIKGTTIDLARTPDYIRWSKRIGKILGDLHNSLSNYSSQGGDFSKTSPIFEGLREKLGECFQNEPKAYNQSEIFERLDLIETNLLPIEERFSQQIIHRDFHPENVLFTGTQKTSRLVAVLDFELVTFGIKIFDLCYLASGILSSLFTIRDKQITNKWYQMFQAILKGYFQSNSLNHQEKDGLWAVLMQLQLLFLHFFHNSGERSKAKQMEQTYFWIFEQKVTIDRVLKTI